MEKLYQKIHIENFDKIRQELFDLITPDRVDSATRIMTSWIPNLNYVFKHCPTLKSFLDNRTKIPPVQVKFYLSPPGIGIGVHIDGLTQYHPFGLSLPLKNTENTYFNWYESDQIAPIDCPLSDDFESNTSRVHWAPKESLRLIDRIEITSPTFTRSDILHDVTNSPDTMRYMVIIRWPNSYKNFSDIINISDMLAD
jgi:hypothetical protein